MVNVKAKQDILQVLHHLPSIYTRQDGDTVAFALHYSILDKPIEHMSMKDSPI